MNRTAFPRSKQGYKQFACRSLAALLGSVAVGALSATNAFAEMTGPRQIAPTLLELIDSIPERPSAVQPVQSDVAVPEVETPDGVSADEQSANEAIRLVLRLGERRVYVYRGSTVEKSYPVAIGRKGWETPTGNFQVLYQITNPGWTHPLTGEVMPPGPDNPLGDRWIAFWTDGTNVIGFHGTPNPESIGKAASHGCVRMYNEDVRQLYEIVAVGTPVTVEL